MLGYKSFVLSVIFVIFNSVQGVAIFLVYCVFNQEVSYGHIREACTKHIMFTINND